VIGSLDLNPVLPALVLSVTGLVVILVQAFGRRDEGERLPFTALSLAGLVVAAGIVLATPVRVDCPCVPANFGGSVVTDALARFLAVLLLATGAAVVLLTRGYARTSGTARGEHFALLLFALVGMLGLVSAVELIALFVALEIMSISLYALAGIRRDRSESLEAALKYFVTGAFSSALLLYGIALLYGVTGTTSLAGIARALEAPSHGGPTALVATGLLLVGFGFKVASVPFHMWAPDVYEGAPTTVTALMAAAVKAAAFGVLLRVFFTALVPLADAWQPAVAGLAILSMVLGNLGALAQASLKRMLAYSSIAHAGYMLTALVAAPDVAVEAVGFYLIGYAAVSVGAFGAVAALARPDREPVRLGDLAGLAERRPALAAAIAVFMISLTGIPVSAGFVGKFRLFSAAVTSGWYSLAVVGVLMSVVSAYYYLRVVVAMYMRAPEQADDWPRVNVPARVVLTSAVAVILWLGVLPGTALAWARLAALAFRR
jgi:NADH-quinone oxidoreductase subunit N